MITDTQPHNPIEPRAKTCLYQGSVGRSICHCRHPERVGRLASVATPLSQCESCPLFALKDGLEVQVVQRPAPQQGTSCMHLGQVSRSVQCSTCDGSTPVAVHACSVHGECAKSRTAWDRIRQAEPGTRVKNCQRCNDFEATSSGVEMVDTLEIIRPARQEIPFVTTADLVNDTLALLPQLPPDITQIVGVARSGLTSAAILAKHLHLPLSILRQSRNDVIDSGHGWRINNKIGNGITLVVDDTVMTGRSLRQTKGVLGNDPAVKFAAIYVNPSQAGLVDFHARKLTHPHVLEWNLFNSVFLPACQFDMDGILCADCPAPYDDDATHYAEFLETVRPLYLVRRSPIHIVTARLEKYREQTLAWLSKWGIPVASLTMGPWANTQERRQVDVGHWKGEQHRRFRAETTVAVGPHMFIESDPLQAQRIAQVSGGIAVCPAAKKVYLA